MTAHPPSFADLQAPSARIGEMRVLMPTIRERIAALWIAVGLTFGLLAREVIGGVLTNSLVPIPHAAHMFTDAAALAIALAAVRMPRRTDDAALRASLWPSTRSDSSAW